MSIWCEDVTVRYGEVVALDKVSLTIESGGLCAVTGASGAGKTTLLWTLAGLVRPALGEVWLDGDQVVDREHTLGAGVVLIPQGNGLASVLTARENVMVALLADGSDPAAAESRADEALEALGVAGQAEQLAEELSGGQRQRVAVARGLALRGDVVLADEVTSDLDAENRDRVLALLRAEAERGAAVVFATNDPEAAAACDAQIRLVDGKVQSGD